MINVFLICICVFLLLIVVAVCAIGRRVDMMVQSLNQISVTADKIRERQE